MIQRKHFLKKERKELSSCTGFTPSYGGYPLNEEPRRRTAGGWVGYRINTCGVGDGFSLLPRTNAGLAVKLSAFPNITKRRSERNKLETSSIQGGKNRKTP